MTNRNPAITRGHRAMRYWEPSGVDAFEHAEDIAHVAYEPKPKKRNRLGKRSKRPVTLPSVSILRDET